MNNAISVMIDRNILRYDSTGKLKWHGRVQEDELSKEVENEKEKDENEGEKERR